MKAAPSSRWRIQRLDTVFSRLVLLVVGLLMGSHALTAALLAAGLPEPQVHAPHGPFDSGPPAWFWWAAAGQLAVAVAAVWLGSRLLSRPIERLADAADRLDVDCLATGGSCPLVPVAGPVEARRAAAVFNAMQARIAQQVVERHRFLAAAAHDLRTPLTRARLRLDPPIAGDAPDLDRLRADLAEMGALLALSFDHLRNRPVDEPPQWLDLQALVESLVDDARDTLGLDERRLRWRGRCAPLQARPLALRRCLGNLIDNALRHGGGGEVLLADGPDAVVVEVADRGPGIERSLLDTAIEPYVQGDGSRGGLGLGLAIAQQTAQQHGGALSLHPREGGGLLVRLRLPRAPVPVAL